MQFEAADIADILDTTGEDVAVKLNGVTVKTIRAKFRKDFSLASPFEAEVGKLDISFMCASADMVDVTSSNTFLVRDVEYRLDKKPQDLSSGFTRVTLAKK